MTLKSKISKQSILIVDDNPANLGVIADHLEAQGFKVLFARRGETGLEKANFTRPDLILLDVMLPGIDGFETCRRLKADETTKDIPVIFMTVLTGTEHKLKGFQAGGADYVTKPFQQEEVLARVITHLRLRELTEQLEQKVEERTRELTVTNLQLEQEVVERKQAKEGQSKSLAKALQATHALRESEERFRHLSEVSFEAVGIHEKGVLIEANEQYFNMFGYQKEELLGKQAIPLTVAPESIDVLKDKIASGASGPYEAIGLRKDGSKFPIEIRAREVEYRGRKERVGIIRDITERKRVEEALWKSQEQYQILFNSMLDGYAMHEIICDDKGTPIDYKFLDINPAFERFTGLGREIIGKTVREALPMIEQHWIETYGRVALTGESIRFENYAQELEKWFEVVAFSPAERQFVTVFQDVTERKQAEQEILQRNKELASLNVLGHQVTSSLSVAQTVGAALEQVVKATHPDLVLLFMREDDNLLLQSVGPKDSPFIHTETPIHCVGECLCGLAVRQGRALYSKDIHSDSRCTWQECKEAGLRSFAALPLYGGDKIIGVLGLASGTERDFEEQATFLETLASQVAIGLYNALLYEQVQRHAEELEERVIKRTQELRDAQEELVRQEKLATLGQLAGSVAHELRNPLGVLSNAVYFLKMILTDANQATLEYLDIITSEIGQAQQIITDLLDFSQIRLADREEIPVSNLVALVLEKYPPPKEVETSTQIASDLPPVYVDLQQMEQVLVNLVTNAYQAMPQGGRLTIRASQEAGRQGDRGTQGLSPAPLLPRPPAPLLRLSITDTGIGISPENMVKLFEPLFTTKARGIGLGLAISKNLMEANGGTIEVESEVGKGSTFTVRLSPAGVTSNQ